MNTKKNQIIVIGGGASGMLAAISARRQGADVTILERNPRIGKKLLATGNGRCNFSNINTDTTCFHGSNPQFSAAALSHFSPQETIRFFEKLGIAHKIEEFGKVFPMSDQASSILDVLMYELNKIGVTIICNSYVRKLTSKQATFKIECENGSTFDADRVILAAGGKAMPASGSDGNGLELVQRLGHTISDVFPGLVQLKLEGPYFKQIDGVKFVGTAEILHNNKSLAKDCGDILFTNYGISGPPILQISRKAGELIHANKTAQLKVTIFDTSKAELIKLLASRWKTGAEKTVQFSLVGLINKRLIPVVLKESGIRNLTGLAGDLSTQDLENLATTLTDWRFKIRGANGWPSAQVTAGGIATNEIDPKTMESKIVKGLFFAGEIIDIDGQCGGFNLQWAWSSGFIAGKYASS